jgi:hypothetical protein
MAEFTTPEKPFDLAGTVVTTDATAAGEVVGSAGRAVVVVVPAPRTAPVVGTETLIGADMRITALVGAEVMAGTVVTEGGVVGGAA